MSRESKKKTKEWLGRAPSIVLGKDVMLRDSGAVSGVVTHTLLGDVGIATAQAAGRVDGFLVDIYPPLTEGEVTVSMSVAGSVIASGSLTLATASRNKSWFFKANDETEVVLAVSDALQMAYAIPTVLSSGLTSRYIQGKALITYTE